MANLFPANDRSFTQLKNWLRNELQPDERLGYLREFTDQELKKYFVLEFLSRDISKNAMIAVILWNSLIEPKNDEHSISDARVQRCFDDRTHYRARFNNQSLEEQLNNGNLTNHEIDLMRNVFVSHRPRQDVSHGLA
jgi:hypothetical protein